MDGTQRCTTWVGVLFLLASVHSATDIVEFLVEDGPLQNVIYLSIDGGVVVVGGRNALYKLSADLNLEAKQSTGPRPDNPQCLPDPLECPQGRTLTDNDNQVLLQLGPAHPLVLTCGTTWQGICLFHHVRRNLTPSRSMDKKLYVNYVASRVSTVAFFLGATLFAASTYDGRPLDYHPFSVSARDLNSNGSLKLHSSDDSSASFVNVDRTLKKSYKVRYVYGTSHKDFAYFVTVQNAGLALELFETRIVRVCWDDPTFLTYTELPVRCGRGKSRFPIAQAASAGPQSQVGDRLLLVAFGKPFGGRMQENDASAGSAVCSFRMQDVEEAFRQAIDDCNAAKPTSQVSHLFHEPGTPQDCTRYDPVDKEDLCTPGMNSYIEGKTFLSGTRVVHLQDRLVTSVTVLRQNMSDVAWIGDNKGFLYKKWDDTPALPRRRRPTPLLRRGCHLSSSMVGDESGTGTDQAIRAPSQPGVFPVQPPPSFNFDKTSEWPAWVLDFDDYRFASGLNERTQEAQVRTLLYTMGRQARKIFQTFNLSEEEAKNYSLVKKKFDDHFVAARNLVYESARFHRRSQEPGETVDQFVTALHTLADRCDYGEVKERMVRDRFVVGLMDAKLSEALLMDATLTLASALAKARLKETLATQEHASRCLFQQLATQEHASRCLFQQLATQQHASRCLFQQLATQ
ncbi:hypothetical protein ISCGN_012897 [Ixodes scapularis]